MKILIAAGIYPPEIGGPATIMSKLAEDLKRAGHEVTVVTYGDPSMKTDGVIRVPRLGSVLSRYGRFASAVKNVLKPDMTVLATDVFSVGIPARLALMGRRNRLVVRLGGEWMWEDAVTNGGLRVTLREYWTQHANGLRHRMKELFAGWVLRRAERIVVTSDMLRTPLKHIAPSVLARVVTVPNVPAHDSCKSAPHAPYGGLRVLYAGRFAPVKNVPFFARALKQAIKAGAAISMSFVGDGEERAECEGILHGLPHVRFLGSKSTYDVLNLLSETDLYVLPSLSDVCPNGVLEALGCGVPCLVTSEHGLPSGVGGLCEIDPRDEQAWMDALIRFASNRSLLDRLRAQIRLPSPPPVTLADIVTASLLVQ